MNDLRLQEWIEATKDTVLLAIYKNLPASLRDQSEDVFQETYFRFYQKFRNREPDISEAAPWLYVVARNECRKQNRGLHRENRRIVRLAEWMIRKPQPRDDESEEALHDYQELLTAIKEIPPDYATVLQFRIEGKSVRDIAIILNVPEGTVKSRLHRGREALVRRIHQEKRGGTENEPKRK